MEQEKNIQEIEEVEEIQTTFNEDSIEILVEEGSVENEYKN